jgi:hypothetical protein
MRRTEKLKELLNSLTEEQTVQIAENLGECEDTLGYIELLLLDEILIFDGDKSLFFKKTGVQVFNAFK